MPISSSLVLQQQDPWYLAQPSPTLGAQSVKTTPLLMANPNFNQHDMLSQLSGLIVCPGHRIPIIPDFVLPTNSQSSPSQSTSTVSSQHILASQSQQIFASQSQQVFAPQAQHILASLPSPGHSSLPLASHPQSLVTEPDSQAPSLPSDSQCSSQPNSMIPSSHPEANGLHSQLLNNFVPLQNISIMNGAPTPDNSSSTPMPPMPFIPIWDPASCRAPDKLTVYDKSTSLVSQFKVLTAKYAAKPKINCSECIAGVKWVEKCGNMAQNKNCDFEAYWHGLTPEEHVPFIVEAYQHFLQSIQTKAQPKWKLAKGQTQ
ncbi:hypothetical protein P691DRAFT_763728 [Macrolepiota fuliginosa MF-IS2]|uniref:Uncharacterized protein n=1 Tax=Macrolepiota fuliginosa MF-IS2 TaxID=1400762 RepID=A0A9P5X448_9AGAR|nr:hypothetical protein P691DRAFT_763728 [Macrolepiota fuliginosa MF-IS2]